MDSAWIGCVECGTRWRSLAELFVDHRDLARHYGAWNPNWTRFCPRCLHDL